MNEEEEITEFQLIKGRHFTPNGLVAYMNKNFGKKLASIQYIYRGRQKLTYNSNDIHHYILKGCLPDYLGKTKIIQKYVPFMEDFKLVELTWD